MRQRTSDPLQGQSAQDSQRRGRRGDRRSSVDSDDSDHSIYDLKLQLNDEYYDDDYSRRGVGSGNNQNASRGASFTRQFEC